MPCELMGFVVRAMSFLPFRRGIFRSAPVWAASGEGRAKANAYIAGGVEDVGADIFERGLCLPSDNKMTKEQQEQIIKVIRRCFE